MLIAVLAALAHPGHGTTDPASARHYLAEPVHLAVILGATAGAAAAIWALRVLRRRSHR